MPTVIHDVEYFTHSEVADQVGIDRTTLWRWKKGGKVPPGRRFRGKQVLFTAAELKAIEEYANRIEPISISDRNQLGLFSSDGGGE